MVVISIMNNTINTMTWDVATDIGDETRNNSESECEDQRHAGEQDIERGPVGRFLMLGAIN